ncbi:ADENOSINE 5'-MONOPHOSPHATE DEAMINASE, EMBRYONIC FACTOR1 [Hibiscus trionum]|uniref:ADENOSINE 5'-MONOPHOSPHATE DEAMINASE, EMBRYONIC FACTOR1 n=1 Tax=Hibiscus trionum TaxID=183268 RepID=A0A9W7HNE1_HIBTR|nr:ADENOSINE 5'-MONOPHOSPHATE DEAMINASE, EMBRYONIC FACTOR1 [Hibiscus trionum]
MDTYTVHLAMAALVGASLVAVSAYYMHRKTLTQLLEFAKTVEREREDVSEGESPQHSKKRRGQRSRRKGNGYYRHGSASLPDVTVTSGVIDGEEKCNGPIHVDGIPAGLPRLHTLHEGKLVI